MPAPLESPPTCEEPCQWTRGRVLAAAGVIFAGILVIVLRKPWALHTPQLYAEDGSVFLIQSEQLGLRALWEPYMGYLHLLPRLAAAAASVVDPRWWPAAYQAFTLAFTLLIVARFASPRLELPGKLWLALSLGLVPHTGEVLLCLTNLQWITAFGLLQQVFMRPPATWRQRLTDGGLLVAAGLTGPFALLLLPLFAWNWVRLRIPGTGWVFALVTACALLQLAVIVGHAAASQGPFTGSGLGRLAVTLGGRLVTRTFLSYGTSAGLSPWIPAALGVGFMAALVAWSLRPHPRRGLRARLVVTGVLTTAAAVYRARPDLWALDDLAFADRYFFMPRVLVLWLLVTEWEAGNPWPTRLLALALGTLAVASNLRDYIVPAPPDFSWEEHSAAIRRGVPAAIPILPEGWILHYPGRPAPATP